MSNKCRYAGRPVFIIQKDGLPIEGTFVEFGVHMGTSAPIVDVKGEPCLVTLDSMLFDTSVQFSPSVKDERNPYDHGTTEHIAWVYGLIGHPKPFANRAVEVSVQQAFAEGKALRMSLEGADDEL